MKVLRRVTALVPAPIGTGYPSQLGRGADVLLATDGRRPTAVARDDGDGCGPLTTVAAHPELPSLPPVDVPGVCYHHAHFDYDGQRLGVLILNDRDASLLPCRHVNRDGR
jgi:hypothetical protein